MDRLIAIDVVRFPEHHVKNHQTETCNKYDITATDFDISPDFLVRGQFSLPHYCHALLRKTFTLCNNQLSEFLQYQVRMVQKPWKWLEYLEILIRNNSPLLSEMGLEHKTQYVPGPCGEPPKGHYAGKSFGDRSLCARLYGCGVRHPLRAPTLATSQILRGKTPLPDAAQSGLPTS